ncbi:hypothetical protein [Fibrella aquatilis]|uniref:Uncharacterized protein n=1 Tax=Fibrella aquatilis TaxID=2817059 RepID=A0A939G7V9_9BACT|nr:hypothetical protein [Fibrella aquatilis]MBO0933829.1 hypothetical protein [Fibrella aquatilis]
MTQTRRRWLWFLMGLAYSAATSAQVPPMGRWQREGTNAFGTRTTYVYEFRPDNQFVFERKVRSDKRKFTTHVVVAGTWQATAFSDSQWQALANEHPALMPYYNDDRLASARKITVHLNRVLSSVARHDDGRVETGEAESLAQVWGTARFDELLTKPDNNQHLTIFSRDDDKLLSLVFHRE